MSPIRPHVFIIASPLVLAALWAVLPAHDQARVIDGDTLIVKGERVRLHGIDAPEREQVCLNANGAPYSCGQAAAARLRKEISSNKVGCDALYHDVYRRQVATCTVNGNDLGDASTLITCFPMRRDSPTSERKFAFSSGAPPVMSTVWMEGVAASSSMMRSATFVGMISVRLGPASTWQW